MKTVLLMGLLAAMGPLKPSASNPRYFADPSGRPVYLVGSHIWNNLVDHTGEDSPLPFDFDGYLQTLRRLNHNCIRLWSAETTREIWGKRVRDVGVGPWRRTGPGMANDGKPKLDLEHFNQAYFDRLRARAMAAASSGIYVSIMLFQGWGVEPKSSGHDPWVHHPFNARNNIQGLNGDPDADGKGREAHELVVPAVTAHQEAYVKKVVDTVNDLDNVLYEIANESQIPSAAWQHHMIDVIKAYEAHKPKQHPVGMTSLGYSLPDRVKPTNGPLYDSAADWVSPFGGQNTEGYRDDPPAADGKKVILVDTDHVWGIGGDRFWVWKSFTSAINILLMDPFLDPTRTQRAEKRAAVEDARKSMGYARGYADRMDLAAATPRGDLASTGYCLANPGSEYLVYQPKAGPFTVHLARGTYDVEWFSPSSGVATPAKPVWASGGTRPFKPPFQGDAVLFLKTDSTGRAK